MLLTCKFKTMTILFSIVLIFVCNSVAHDNQAPHSHNVGLPPHVPRHPVPPPHSHGPQGQHTHSTGTHSHTQGLPTGTHSHGPGQRPHSHGQNAHHKHPTTPEQPPKRILYQISNLWNGSIDAASQAQDKGGNHVKLTLEGMKKNNSIP